MTTATQSEPKTSGRVEANGIDYYYEIDGQGEPLLLLHGGLGSAPISRGPGCRSSTASASRTAGRSRSKQAK